MKGSIYNVIGYGSTGPGARIYINDETNSEKEYYVGECGEYAPLKELIESISESFDITGNFNKIRDARKTAINNYEKDQEDVSDYNRRAYYGYCMNGGGGYKEFRKMYNS